MESTMHPNKPCQYYLGIPQGKKAFVEIENGQSRITFTFVTKQSSTSSQPILVSSTYSDNVALTVLYGTMCEMVDNATNYYFTVENVHAIHGTTLTYENWGNKWTALLNYLPTLTILTRGLLIGAPLMCATSAELEATLRTNPLIAPLSRVMGQNLYESQKVHIYRGSLASGWSHFLHPVKKQIIEVPVVPTATIRGKWWVTLSDDPEIYYLTKPNHLTKPTHSPLIAHVPDRITSDLLRHEFTYSLDEQEMSEEDEEKEEEGNEEEEGKGEKNERKKVCFECVWTTTRGKCGWKPVKKCS
jgi:hypothetical protein